MLYIIGLGLNEKGISIEGLEAVKKCKKIYLESYTVEFPYGKAKLEKIIGKKIISLGRGEVENNIIVSESKKSNVALLVYGSPLFATTHVSIIEECKLKKVKVKVIYSASVFDALGESGLQLYKFGKIASMPAWQENFRPNSFMDLVVDNQKIEAHSLILIDIGLEFKDALDQLVKSCRERKVKLEKILVCSRLGVNGNFYYEGVSELKKKKIKVPFCFVIPGKMHFLEEKFLTSFGKN